MPLFNKFPSRHAMVCVGLFFYFFLPLRADKAAMQRGVEGLGEYREVAERLRRSREAQRVREGCRES